MYFCEKCKTKYIKKTFKCSNCNSWDISEMIEEEESESVDLEDFHIKDPISFYTNIGEFDRVCNPQRPALITFAGEPGIGKSTLLSQVAMECGEKVLYLSGEEPIGNVVKRLQKVSTKNINNVTVYNLTYIEDVENMVKKHNPSMVIIDSLHTTRSRKAAGTLNQLKEVTSYMIFLTRKYNLLSVLVSHITKDGYLSGPKTIEHMVDTVLYLEGNRQESLRLLKSTKNRLGSTANVGIFRMDNGILQQVENPSDILLPNRDTNHPGSTIMASLEGNRSFLLEVQALVSPSTYSQTEVIGYDHKRVRMIVAILQNHCKFDFRFHDIYINLVGGIKIEDTAADLPIAVALVSSLWDRTIGRKVCFFGELGLTGEIRKVPGQEARINEAKRLGYEVYANDNSVKSVTYLDKLMKLLNVRGNKRNTVAQFNKITGDVIRKKKEDDRESDIDDFLE
jgi:DNA repair protein RadA/Sms